MREKLPVLGWVALVILSFAGNVNLASAQERGTYRRIAFGLAHALQNYHYSRMPFDDQVSIKLQDNFLEMLDKNKELFLQSDIADFAKFKDQHDDKLLKDEGNLELFAVIYQRFDQRSKEYAEWIISSSPQTFELSEVESVTLNEKSLDYPKTIDEQQQRWKDAIKYNVFLKMMAGQTFEAAVKNIRATVERNQFIAARTSMDEKLDIYLTALANVYDSNSDYFSPASMRQFSDHSASAFAGIGIKLNQDSATGLVIIDKIIADGPVSRLAAIRQGDRIIAVKSAASQQMVDVKTLSEQDIVELLRGAAGSTVEITVEHQDGNQVTYSIKRDYIRSDEQKLQTTIVTANSDAKAYRLAVIHLPSFYRATQDKEGKIIEPGAADELQTELLKINQFQNQPDKKVDGVILDLRSNGGGLLGEAIKICNLFLGKGLYVQLKSVDEPIHVYGNDTDQAVYKGPLMVVSNRMSASASEIVVGALKDYRRAIIVGDSRTFGKGTVQDVYPMSDLLNLPDQNLGGLKMTVSAFYQPNGKSHQGKGISSDIVFSSGFDFDIFSSDDATLNTPALDQLAVQPLTDVNEDTVSELLSLHQKRLKDSGEYHSLQNSLKDYQTFLSPDKIEYRKSWLQSKEQSRQQQYYDLVRKIRELGAFGEQDGSDDYDFGKSFYSKELLNIMVDYVELRGNQLVAATK